MTINLVKRMRLEAGKSQEQLAELMHTSRQSISQYENGQCQPPLEFIQELSKILGIEITIGEGELSMDTHQHKSQEISGELIVVQNWRKELRDFLENEPHLTLNKLDTYQRQLAEKYQLSLWKKDIATYIGTWFTEIPFYELNREEINYLLDRHHNVELEESLVLTKTPNPSEDFEDYEGHTANLRPEHIAKERLKSAESVNFVFKFGENYEDVLDTIEEFLDRYWNVEGTEEQEIIDFFWSYPIEAKSMVSTFFVSERKELIE